MIWMPLSMRRRDVDSAAERATLDVSVPIRPTRIHDDACSLRFNAPVLLPCTYLGCTGPCQNMSISRMQCIRDAFLFISRMHSRYDQRVPYHRTDQCTRDMFVLWFSPLYPRYNPKCILVNTYTFI
ncbi:hypothetical protein AHAS_Ahas09G0172100 [Arachis hypogaea]